MTKYQKAKRLGDVSRMADTYFYGGIINKDQHAQIKSKVRELELDNIFKAMADYCNQ